MNAENFRKSAVVSFCVTLFSFLGTSTLSAAPVACEYGELTRTVEVIYSNPGQPVPCEVLYDKPAEGGSSTLWRAQSEAGFCEARAREFVTKLGDMGWQCSEPMAEESEPEEDAEAG